MKGIGDDAALLKPRPGFEIVVTTDSFQEGIHFEMKWGTPGQLGAKALVANLSDIAAMAALPLAAVSALSLPADLEVETAMELVEGMAEIARRYGCPLVGGNIARSAAGIGITITVVGEVEEGRALRRSGAAPGQEIWVTGMPGLAHAGLVALQRRLEPSFFENSSSPGDSSSIEVQSAIRAFLEPRPRIDAARFLARKASASCMIDLSDGLSGDLEHLCEESGAGAVLSLERLPASRAVRTVAERCGADPLEYILNGGEDFELLFTAPPGKVAPVLPEFKEQLGLELTRIGEVTGQKGLFLKDGEGTLSALRPSGFDHLS